MILKKIEFDRCALSGKSCEFEEDRGAFDFCKITQKPITEDCNYLTCPFKFEGLINSGKALRIAVALAGKPSKDIAAIPHMDTYGTVITRAGYDPDEYTIVTNCDGKGHKHFMVTNELYMIILNRRN
jgi:hypothetical protein